MKLSNLFKEKVSPVINDAPQITYMGDNAAFVCEDKTDSAKLTTKLLAQHVNYNLDQPITFPRFCINKTTSLPGMIGMHSKNVLTLDADDVPTEGSNKLIVSDTLYHIVEDLQSQIDELKSLIKQ